MAVVSPTACWTSAAKCSRTELLAPPNSAPPHVVVEPSTLNAAKAHSDRRGHGTSAAKHLHTELLFHATTALPQVLTEPFASIGISSALVSDDCWTYAAKCSRTRAIVPHVMTEPSPVDAAVPSLATCGSSAAEHSRSELLVHLRLHRSL